MKKHNGTWVFLVFALSAGLFDALVCSSLDWQGVATKIVQVLSAVCILMTCRHCLRRSRVALWISPVMVLMAYLIRTLIGGSWIAAGFFRFGLYRMVYVILLFVAYDMLRRCRGHASIIKRAAISRGGRILYPWKINSGFEMICLSCAAMGAGLLWLFDAPLSLCIILFTQTLCIALRLLPSGRKHVFCYRIIVVLTGLCLLTWANVRNGQIVWERVSVWKMEIIAAKHIVTMVPFCGDSSHTLPGRHFFSTSRVLENTAVMHGWGASLLCLAVCLMMITGMKLFVRMKHDKQWNMLSEAAILYFVIQTIGATAVFLGLMPDLDFMLPLFYGGWTIPIGLMAIVFFPKLFSKDSSGSHRFSRQNQSISK